VRGSQGLLRFFAIEFLLREIVTWQVTWTVSAGRTLAAHIVALRLA
jgi:hypothetical protein